MNRTYQKYNYILRLIFEGIKLACTIFYNVSFNHVFKEPNKDIDALSNVSILLEVRKWHIQESLVCHFSKYIHTPFY